MTLERNPGCKTRMARLGLSAIEIATVDVNKIPQLEFLQLAAHTSLAAASISCPQPTELPDSPVMKAVPHLSVDLPGIGIVRSAECETVVEKEPSTSCIQGSDGNGEALSEGLPNGKVKCCVTGKMARIIERSICEAGSVVKVAAGGDLMRQSEVETRVESVALIVIEQKVATAARLPSPREDWNAAARVLKENRSRYECIVFVPREASTLYAIFDAHLPALGCSPSEWKEASGIAVSLSGTDNSSSSTPDYARVKASGRSKTVSLRVGDPACEILYAINCRVARSWYLLLSRPSTPAGIARRSAGSAHRP